MLALIFSSTQVFFSMLEIYNEQVRSGGICSHAVFSACFFFFLLLYIFISAVQVLDLLVRGSRSSGGLRVREEQHRGFYVEGLRTVPCESAAQVHRSAVKGFLSGSSCLR